MEKRFTANLSQVDKILDTALSFEWEILEYNGSLLNEYLITIDTYLYIIIRERYVTSNSSIHDVMITNSKNTYELHYEELESKNSVPCAHCGELVNYSYATYIGYDEYLCDNCNDELERKRWREPDTYQELIDEKYERECDLQDYYNSVI